MLVLMRRRCIGKMIMSGHIFVPRDHDHSDLRQGSRALAGPDFLSMRTVFVSYSQPIRFVRLDKKSVNPRLPVLDKARALDPCRGLWGREWSGHDLGKIG